MTSSDPPNGTGYLLPSTGAQGLANYPHARTIPSSARTIFVSGTSSRRADGTVVGCETTENGGHVLDCGAQTAAVLQNIETIIKGATDGRRGLESVVDATVFLTDMSGDYSKMNAEWNKIWPDRAKAPARTCVQVAALPNDKLNVEIKCQAVVD
ncbi:Endoribonuclease L-PSP/chorismate mutase-like protein [Lasiosphaeria hispida]|uniref:Endoribonuclease L-PSP/chorismate mutase-like protein n=1 Tax=Lasiosphaeria hispida TaxID=260671 RepID=A0AAJ0MJ57_9PEZI|nr:Endoribonuclease L-PSP/chorismate mutase-like protein [Lasiosphaeria hispida]